MFSKRDLLIFIYKYRYRLLLSFMVPFCLAVAISFIPTPRYKAESVLIVRLGSEYVYQPQVDTPSGNSPSAIPFDRDLIFKSEMAILNSSDLHEQVIRTLSVEKVFPSLVAPQGFWRWLKELKANLLSDATQAQEEQEKQRKLIARAVTVFSKRFDVTLQQESAVIQVSFEHEDHATAKLVLGELLEAYLTKRKRLYMDIRTELASEQVDMRRERVLKAAKAVENFKRTNKLHSVSEEREQLLKLRSEAEQRALRIASPDIKDEIATYKRDLDALDAYERELKMLEKELQIAETSYAVYSRKLDEAKAFEDVQRTQASSVRIIQEPTVGAEPQRIQVLIVVLGTFLSFIAMFLVAALTSFLRKGFTTAEEVEELLRIPVLTNVPFSKIIAVMHK